MPRHGLSECGIDCKGNTKIPTAQFIGVEFTKEEVMVTILCILYVNNNLYPIANSIQRSILHPTLVLIGHH